MSIQIIVDCDGRNCSEQRYLDPFVNLNDLDESIESMNWTFDSENDAHYCPKCSRKE